MSIFKVDTVIFDLDGTLVDTAGDLHASTNFVLKSLGRPLLPIEDVIADVGFGALKLISGALDRTGGIDGIDLEAKRQEFLAYYIDNIAVHSELFAGGQEMLHSLTDAGIKMGVCTNKPYALAVRLLEELNLIHYFQCIKGGDSFSFKKPDARHLTETAKETGGNSFIMVGDASPDIIAAKNAGVPSIAASYGYADMDLASLKPDTFIESLGEVADLVLS